MTQKTYIIWPIEIREEFNHLCAMNITDETLEKALIAYTKEFDLENGIFSGVLGWATFEGTETGTAAIELSPKVKINKIKRKK